jgi:hypothetical protein
LIFSFIIFFKIFLPTSGGRDGELFFSVGHVRGLDDVVRLWAGRAATTIDAAGNGHRKVPPSSYRRRHKQASPGFERIYAI